MPLIASLFEKLRRNRREGFPRPAYFIPGRDGDGGPGQIPELFVTRRRRIFLKNAKTVFDDETYLEKRLGIVKHVIV